MSEITPEQTLDLVRAGMDPADWTEPARSPATLSDSVVVQRGAEEREAQRDRMTREILANAVAALDAEPSSTSSDD